jgi:hypothetical protein
LRMGGWGPEDASWRQQLWFCSVYHSLLLAFEKWFNYFWKNFTLWLTIPCFQWHQGKARGRRRVEEPETGNRAPGCGAMFAIGHCLHFICIFFERIYLYGDGASWSDFRKADKDLQSSVLLVTRFGWNFLIFTSYRRRAVNRTVDWAELYTAFLPCYASAELVHRHAAPTQCTASAHHIASQPFFPIVLITFSCRLFASLT